MGSSQILSHVFYHLFSCCICTQAAHSNAESCSISEVNIPIKKSGLAFISRKNLPVWHYVLLCEIVILNRDKGGGKQNMFTLFSPPLLKHSISQ